MPNLNAGVVLSLNSQGDQVKVVQANLAIIGAAVPITETSVGAFGAGTADAIKGFQLASKLPATGMVDAATQAMLNNAATVAAANQSSMSGQIAMDYGLPANLDFSRGLARTG